MSTEDPALRVDNEGKLREIVRERIKDMKVEAETRSRLTDWVCDEFGVDLAWGIEFQNAQELENYIVGYLIANKKDVDIINEYTTKKKTAA